MVRFNKLKLYLLAGEAKPGGVIGAMLSPYLFSNNMSDFCKRFNDQTKEYNSGIWLPVSVSCDVLNKTYTFIVKPLSISLFLLSSFLNHVRLDLVFLYDIVCFYSDVYKMDLYRSALIVLSLLKSFRRKTFVVSIADSLKRKLQDCFLNKKNS